MCTDPLTAVELAAIRERHRPVTSDGRQFCVADGVIEWPCDAERLAAEVVRLQEQLAAVRTAPCSRPWLPQDGDSRCQRCGHVNPPWFTDSETWNRISSDDRYAVLCPACFISKADSRGLAMAWRLEPEAPGAWYRRGKP